MILLRNKSFSLNLDVPLPKKGRVAPKMSEEEFKIKMYDWLDKNSSEDHVRHTPGSFFYRITGFKSPLQEDFKKIDFDWENHDISGGIRFTKTGVPFLLGYAGGDWQVPILLMIYWDGKKFRGYIPEHGNAYYRKEMRALDSGEDLEALVGIKDPKADVKECIKDFEARIKL